MSLMATEHYWTLAEVAEHLNIKYATLRVYVAKANRRRRDGEPRPGDIPPPDRYYGQSPVWKPSTIEKWEKRRPGRGAGGAAARMAKQREREHDLDES